MKQSAQTLHTAHRDKNRHLHFLMLLLPSIAFVLVLSLFMRNRYAPVSTQMESPAAISLTPIVVKDTTIQVRIAKTEAEHRQGLSGTQSLQPDEGMLFVFESKQRPPFWMKDMLIALDFIWIRDGKVSQLNRNVPAPTAGTPDSKLPLIVPNDPVDYVLEVNAGFIDSHQIVVGDSVTIP
jgi:uncharacterized membrane protein (UPF0127 family)